MVRSTHRSQRPNAESGFTLVELMITMIISALVATSTFMFFAGQRQIYETQTKVLNVQQNLWAAMETVTRFMRAAGTGMRGCVRPDSDGFCTDGTCPDTGDPPPSGATMPQTGFRVWKKGDAAPSRIAPLWIQNGASGAPDTVTIAFGNGTFGNFSDSELGSDMPADLPTTTITALAGFGAAFRADEFIMLLDTSATPVSGNMDRGCTLYQITSIATDTLTTDSVLSDRNPGSDAANLLPFTLTGGAGNNGGIRHIGQLNQVQFAISTPTGGAPQLTMERLDGTAGAQVLAVGIEDMQISYACDLQTAPLGARDGVLTENTTVDGDEWVHNVSGESPIAACNAPSAIRITLMARSITPDTTLTSLSQNAKGIAEDGIAGPNDRFRHRTLTTTIYPRN